MKGTEEVKARQHVRAVIAAAVLFTACGGEVVSATADTLIEEDETSTTVATTPSDEATFRTPTVDDLAGLWQLDHACCDDDFQDIEVFWRFSQDGTFLLVFGERFGTTEPPLLRGPFELSGDTLSWTNTEGDGCDKDLPALWTVGVSDDGRLRAEGLPSEFPCHVDPGTVWTFTRISPQSRPAESMTVEIDTDEEEPVTSPLQLMGVWRVDGTGLLLLLDLEDGTYQLDSAGQIGNDPEDSGSLELTEDGDLVFTSGPESRLCEEGDVMTWSDIDRSRATQDHEITSEVFVLEPVVDDGSCRGLTTSTPTWLQIVNVETSLGE